MSRPEKGNPLTCLGSRVLSGSFPLVPVNGFKSATRNNSLSGVMGMRYLDGLALCFLTPPGSRAHRSGGKAFPSKPLRRGACGSTAPKAEGRDLIRESAALAASRMREERKRQREQHDEDVKACLESISAETVLEGRRVLQQACQWQAIPHECPCVHINFDAADACARKADDVVVSKASEDWKKRHVAVSAEALPTLNHINSTPRVSRCCQHACCFCGIRGRQVLLFWQRFQRCMKARFWWTECV